MHRIYISYEEGIKDRYTLENMKSIYKKEADKTEYPTFDIWLADMIKSGVFEVREEAYRYFKTAIKTAKENSLTLVNGNGFTEHTMLFDFSLVEGLDIPEEEKELIKQDAMKHCSIVNSTAFVITFPDRFTSLYAVVDFACQKVFDAKTYKRLYVVMKANHVKYAHGERNSAYDKFFTENRVEFEVSCNGILAEEIEI